MDVIPKVNNIEFLITLNMTFTWIAIRKFFNNALVMRKKCSEQF